MYDKHFILALFHVLFVAPLLLSIGFMRSTTPDWLYKTILVLGFVIFIYHSYKLYARISTNSPNSWINLIHILIVAPLLIYTGYNAEKTYRGVYDAFIMVGFAAGGYHLYNMINSMNIVKIH